MSATLDTLALDILQPFTLEDAAVRGRLMRLGPVVDTILKRHEYPDAVSALLAEALCVASLLAANLKQEGIITLQMRGSGPVSLLVADVEAQDVAADTGQLQSIALRGYADIAPERTSEIGDHASPRDLLGDDGYLAITYDPGRGLQRYQGVVALEGASLAEALSTYFTQSQQLDMLMMLAAHPHEGSWAAGALMIERVAAEGGTGEGDTMEPWRASLAYMHTLRRDELLDATLTLPDLLYRLFHEQNPRVTDAVRVGIGCRCSRDRILQILLSMNDADRADMVVDGHASVHCQFCNSTELYTPSELKLSFNQ